MSPEHWRDMSDEEMRDVILSRGTEFPYWEVTEAYIRGMRNYRQLYPTYDRSLLSLMVRIDMANGINTCSCGSPH